MQIRELLKNVDDPKELAEMVLAYLGESLDDAMTTFAEDGSTMGELKERARAVLARLKKTDKDLMSMTITEVLKMMRDTGAGLSQHVIKNGKDNAQAAVIIIDGEEETEALLAAIEEVSKDW